MKLLLNLALVLTLILLPQQNQENSLPVLDSGDGIILHFWLPTEALEAKLPQGFSPAAFSLDPLASSPPANYSDAMIIIRKASWHLSISGSRTKEKDILEALVAVPVKKKEKQSGTSQLNLLILQHYSDSKLLELATPGITLNSKLIEGNLDLRANSAGGLRFSSNFKLADFNLWEINAATTEETRFSCPWTQTTFHFPQEEGIKSFTLSTEKNSWFRSHSQLTGFRDSNPVNQFGEWRWADSNTYLVVFEDNR